LFSKTGCFVEIIACYMLGFVSAIIDLVISSSMNAIILRNTRNIYKICNSKPQISQRIQWCNFHRNWSTFENVIEKMQRGPDFMKHGVYANRPFSCNNNITRKTIAYIF